MIPLLFTVVGLLAALPLAIAGDVLARRHVATDTWLENLG